MFRPSCAASPVTMQPQGLLIKKARAELSLPRVAQRQSCTSLSKAGVRHWRSSPSPPQSIAVALAGLVLIVGDRVHHARHYRKLCSSVSPTQILASSRLLLTKRASRFANPMSGHVTGIGREWTRTSTMRGRHLSTYSHGTMGVAS